MPARGRRGGRRDVHGLGDPRVPGRDAPRAARVRRRDRRRPHRRRHVPLRRRHPDRARGARGRVGRRRSREAGLRDVHAQGDLGAARRDRRDDRRAALPRAAAARRPEPERGADPRPAAGGVPGLRDVLPRRPRRPLPARGVGADPVGVRHRERVALPPCRDRLQHARDRDRPVGRDDRHAGGDEGGPLPGSARAGGDQRDGQPDDARVRLGALHPRRARDRRGRVEDLHRAADPALPAGAAARDHPRHDRAGPRRDAAAGGARAARPRPGDARARRRWSSRSPIASPATSSSSTSGATSACRSPSRARSS